MGTGRSSLLHLVREATSLFIPLSKIANCNIQDAKQIASTKRAEKAAFRMTKYAKEQGRGKEIL